MSIKKDEVYFPRGRSSSSKPALRKPKDALFKKHKKPKKKVKQKKTFYEELERNLRRNDLSGNRSSVSIKYSIEPLTYETLEEGMVVLGRVRVVLPYHLYVCLPGRLSAKVSITAVSTPYTEALAKLQSQENAQQECPGLKELFRVGQLVVCCVQEVKKEGDQVTVSASLEPSLVNKDRGHYSVSASQVVVAAVASVEDHGYTLHTGISGLTAFLRRTHTKRFVELHNQGRPLVVGEVLRCLVLKCNTGKTSSRVEVTIDPRALSRSVMSEINAQTLRPPATVHCTVQQVFQKGFVVAVGKSTGFIEANQLPDCWSVPSSYEPGLELTASVLYVHPETDFQTQSKSVYLTLKDINASVVPKMQIGEVVQAVVSSSSYKGVCLCLGERRDNHVGNKGFVSTRRLGEAIAKEKVQTAFPKGKLVTTRILAFDFMEEVYNCTLERDKLEQKYWRVDQLSAGDRVTCQVTQVEGNGVRLALGPIRMFAFKEHSADVPYANMYENFTIGDVVDARVLKVDPESQKVLVTLKETLIRSPSLASFEDAQVNDRYWGVVRFVHDSFLYVTFYNDVAGNLRLSEPLPPYFPGQLVECYIAYVNAAEKKLLLSLTPSQQKEPKQLLVGKQYQLVVSAVAPDHLAVSACDHQGVEGIIPKCHLQNRDAYQEGDFVKAWLYMNKSGKLYFSTSPAILGYLKAKEENIKPNRKLVCCVRKVFSKKNTISVYTSLAEFPVVKVLNWFDGEVPEMHQIVQLYVEQFDRRKKSLVLTSKRPSADLESNKEVESKLSCKPKKHAQSIVANELIVKSKTELEDEETIENKRKHIFSEEHEIDALSNNSGKVKLKKKQRNKTEESLTLDCLESEEVTEKVENKNKKVKGKSKIKEVGEKCLTHHITPGIELEEEKDEKESGETQTSQRKTKRHISEKGENESKHKTKKLKKETEINKKPQEPSSKRTLSEIGFCWDVKPEDLSTPVENSVEDSDEDTEETTTGKRKKRNAGNRKVAAREEEARVRGVEQSLLDSETNPQSADQFDRAVLAHPDDADLWIKYMSHHLQATEIEKARAVARRALQTINQRHEVERLNVWIALLNLEHLFGTQESLKDSFNEALRTNDEFTVYCKMLQVYSQTKASQEAEQLVSTMVRKFRDSPSCWTHCLTALMSCELPDKARNLLQRAITALPTREHVSLLCKFALLENQHGFSEQAQTLFEHILTSYPKRVDVWSVYVDMLVKSDKVQVARQILGRASRQKLPARKMKMLFSKWVSFEERQGTPETVQHVRKQALAYVNNITKSLD